MEGYYELDHYRHDHDMLDVGALTKMPDNTLCDENDLEEYRKLNINSIDDINVCYLEDDHETIGMLKVTIDGITQRWMTLPVFLLIRHDNYSSVRQYMTHFTKVHGIQQILSHLR